MISVERPLLLFVITVGVFKFFATILLIGTETSETTDLFFTDRSSNGGTDQSAEETDYFIEKQSIYILALGRIPLTLTQVYTVHTGK
jgi:hypothetical protein